MSAVPAMPEFIIESPKPEGGGGSFLVNAALLGVVGYGAYVYYNTKIKSGQSGGAPNDPNSNCIPSTTPGGAPNCFLPLGPKIPPTSPPVQPPPGSGPGKKPPVILKTLPFFPSKPISTVPPTPKPKPPVIPPPVNLGPVIPRKPEGPKPPVIPPPINLGPVIPRKPEGPNPPPPPTLLGPVIPQKPTQLGPLIPQKPVGLGPVIPQKPTHLGPVIPQKPIGLGPVIPYKQKPIGLGPVIPRKPEGPQPPPPPVNLGPLIPQKPISLGPKILAPGGYRDWPTSNGQPTGNQTATCNLSSSILTRQKIFGIPTAYPAANGQPGCYFIRKYDVRDKDPYQSGTTNLFGGLAWTPELAPYGVGMTACLLNVHALSVARKYNNYGNRDEQLMVWTDNKNMFHNRFNPKTFQWYVVQDSVTNQEAEISSAFVPLGPVGSEWAVPYKPGPNDPSPTDPRQYFKFWDNYSNITSPTTTLASGNAGQTADGAAAIQSCATNPSCDAITFWDGPMVGSWTTVQANPPGSTLTVTQNVPPGQPRAVGGVYIKN